PRNTVITPQSSQPPPRPNRAKQRQAPHLFHTVGSHRYIRRQQGFTVRDLKRPETRRGLLWPQRPATPPFFPRPDANKHGRNHRPEHERTQDFHFASSIA